jgi:hypothetical protein
MEERMVKLKSLRLKFEIWLLQKFLKIEARLSYDTGELLKENILERRKELAKMDGSAVSS